MAVRYRHSHHLFAGFDYSGTYDPVAALHFGPKHGDHFDHLQSLEDSGAVPRFHLLSYVILLYNIQ